jgi:hypothetical protein
MVEDGQKAQDRFFAVLFNGFSREEMEQFQQCFDRVTDNIRHFEKSSKGGVPKHGMGKAE